MNFIREVSPHSVLVVDDDPHLRDYLSMRLEAAGFTVRQAEDGIDGLVKLRAALPQVIISDLQMPRMEGMEFLSVVHQRFPFIPVIALSGQIPDEIPATAQPAVWLEKGTLKFSEFMQTVHDLAGKTPDRASLPQVVTLPERTRPSLAGYFILTCPDCLRGFKAATTPGNQPLEATAVCTYCAACVPFLAESSALQ